MTSAAKALPAVLARIDADLDQSVERLFDLVRIPSISTDSAYKDFCRAAADSVAKDLESLGFEAAVRPTAGHPVVVGKTNGASAANGGPRVLFYGTTTSSRSIRSACRRRRSSRRSTACRTATGIIRGRGACDDKGPADDLHRGLPRLQGGHRQAAARHHHDDRGRGGMRSEPVDFVRSNAAEVQATRAGLRHGMWNPSTPLVTTSLRGLLYERSSSPAPTATCIPVVGGAAATRSRSPASLPLHGENGRIMVPGYDGVTDLPADIKARI